MKTFRSRAALALATALLVACGGDDDSVEETGRGAPSGAPSTRGSFTSVVSFGDSLSDVGSYAPATSLSGDGQAPYFGGKFTTNSQPASASATVWVENVAALLGIVVTPHEVGFDGRSVKCPAAADAALAASCTGYAQGGARVTNPAGIGKTADGGALTVPMATQIANHLARFGSFKPSDLIFVYGGSNDVLVQFETFAAGAAQIQAQRGAGALSAEQADAQLSAAQAGAREQMKQAALELSGYVRSEILAKGGRYVAVLNLPDSAMTPFGSTLDGSLRPVLTDLVDTFNLWLREGLGGQPVLWVDANAVTRAVYQNPSAHGLANVALPACDPAKISVLTGGAVTTGSSLFCNSTPGVAYNGLRAGADAGTWLFADGLHPTTGGHRLFSDQVLQQLRTAGWIE